MMSDSSSTSGMSYGWLFIVLLLFFGIFGGWGGCGNGFFGNRGNCGNAAAFDSGAIIGSEINSMTDLMAMKSNQCGNGPQLQRDILELKYTTGQQSAVLTQQLDTAFRTIINNQDAGFSNLRIQQLTDTIDNKNMELMKQNSEIMALKSQLYADARFNALERQVESGFAQVPTRPPFYPAGCTPCNLNYTGCGNGLSV